MCTTYRHQFFRLFFRQSAAASVSHVAKTEFERSRLSIPTLAARPQNLAWMDVGALVGSRVPRGNNERVRALRGCGGVSCGRAAGGNERAGGGGSLQVASRTMMSRTAFCQSSSDPESEKPQQNACGKKLWGLGVHGVYYRVSVGYNP